MVVYQGIFFENEEADFIREVEGESLEWPNAYLHCTFKFFPSDSEIFDDIVGEEVEVELVGYANDGKNSGFKLRLPEYVMKYYQNEDRDYPDTIVDPHMTVSIMKNGQAFKTKDLKFEDLEEPVKVTGRFGYWIKEDDKSYISYDKYLNKKYRSF